VYQKKDITLTSVSNSNINEIRISDTVGTGVSVTMDTDNLF